MWRIGKARFAQALRDEYANYHSMRIKLHGEYDHLKAHDETARNMFRKAIAFAEGHFIGEILMTQPLEGREEFSSSDPYDDTTPSFVHYRGNSSLGRYFTIDGTPTNLYMVVQKSEAGRSETGEVSDAVWRHERIKGLCFEEEDSVQLELMKQYIKCHLSQYELGIHNLERGVRQPVFDFSIQKTRPIGKKQGSELRAFSGLYLDCTKVIQGFEHQALVDMLLREEP